MTLSRRDAARPHRTRRRAGALIAAMVVALGGTAAGTHPARADDPSFLSIGAGYYDLLHDADSAEFRMEYRSAYRYLIFKPFGGVTLTSEGAVHGYAGILSDFYFGKRIVVSPSVADRLIASYRKN